MLQVYKMDLFRLRHSKIFYVALTVMTVMAFSLVYSGMSPDLGTLLGVMPETVTGDEFMTGMLGMGVVAMLVGITLSLFVCGDYSSGFAKNVFTVHGNKRDYLLGKLLSMATVSAVLAAVYTLESILSLQLFGGGFQFGGSLLGLGAFLIEKWLLIIAISSLVMLVNVATIKLGWGILATFLIATGGLTMGITLFADAFGLDFINRLLSFTASMTFQSLTLDFSGLAFIRVLATAALWTAASSFLSLKLLNQKDV